MYRNTFYSSWNEFYLYIADVRIKIEREYVVDYVLMLTLCFQSSTAILVVVLYYTQSVIGASNTSKASIVQTPCWLQTKSNSYFLMDVVGRFERITKGMQGLDFVSSA